MKVLIINPPAYLKKDYIREGRCMQTKSSWAALWMPLSLAYIAAVLRGSGQNVKIVDCIAEKKNHADLIKIIKDFEPRLVVLNTAFPSIIGDKKTASQIKKVNPGILTVIIGMFPTLLGKRSIKGCAAIDMAVSGEPEWTIRQLVLAIEKKLPPSKIPGLIYRPTAIARYYRGDKRITVDEIIQNKPQDFDNNNINDLPHPARDLLKNEAYRLPIDGKKFTLLNIARGCPYECSFCVANIYYGKKFRRRNINSIIEEIEECVNKHGITNFLFWGESFTIDPEYGESICDKIIKRKLKIKWSTTSRVDTLNKKLLKKMKQAGCIVLGLGIESIHQPILDQANKKMRVEEINKAISTVRQAGIKTMGHFIFGLPGETQETARETIRFAVASNLDYAQFYCAIPYPRTQLEKTAKDKGWIKTTDFANYDLSLSVMSNEALSPREVKQLRDQAYRRFYLRPKMFVQTIKEVSSLKSLLSVLNFVKWIKQ